MIGIATGIVARLARDKRRDPILFGILTAAAAFVGAVAGAYLIGFVGEIFGVVIGGVIIEEMVRNMPEKPAPKKQVFCPQCGFQQGWQENKLCERCESALRK